MVPSIRSSIPKGTIRYSPAIASERVQQLGCACFTHHMTARIESYQFMSLNFSITDRTFICCRAVLSTCASCGTFGGRPSAPRIILRPAPVKSRRDKHLNLEMISAQFDWPARCAKVWCGYYQLDSIFTNPTQRWLTCVDLDSIFTNLFI